MRFVSDACSAMTASVRPVICCLIVLDSLLFVLNTIPFFTVGCDVEIRKSVYDMRLMRLMWSMRCFVGPVISRGTHRNAVFVVKFTTLKLYFCGLLRDNAVNAGHAKYGCRFIAEIFLKGRGYGYP